MIAPRLPREVIRRFATMNPIVVIGYHLPAETTFDTVNADDVRGGELAVEELVARGYSDIGMLSLAERSESDVSTQRKIGYRARWPPRALPITSGSRKSADPRSSRPRARPMARGARSPRGGLLLERPDRGAAARHGLRARAARARRPRGHRLRQQQRRRPAADLAQQHRSVGNRSRREAPRRYCSSVLPGAETRAISCSNRILCVGPA